MPVTQTDSNQTSLTQNLPSKLQNEAWGGLWGAAAGTIWPEGNFGLAPQYGGHLTAPQGEQTVNWYSNVNALGQPDFNGVRSATAGISGEVAGGIRDPNQIGVQGNYTPQSFQVNPFQFNDPYAGYNGGPGMQVRAPAGVGSTADYYRTNVDQVQTPAGVSYDRISGVPTVSGPQLQNYQMTGPERVTAPGGLNSFQLNAPGQVSAGTVNTQSFNAPGTAESYMSPYTRNVLDVQKDQAQRDYNEQITGLHSQAAKSGAFGGSRQAVVDAEANRDLQNRMSQIEATGQQDAFQRAQAQFNQEQGLGLQGQQFNVGTGLQAGLANQQAGMTTSLANQQAALAAQGLGTQAGLQAQLANQQAGLTAGGQNLQALLQTQGLGAQLGMQGQLANQQMSYQQQLANQQAGLQAGMFNNTQSMEAQRLNQAANLQAGLASQQLGYQGATYNAGLDLQSQLANQAAQQQQLQRQYGALGQQGGWGLQAGLQGQQLGMQGQQLGMQSNQFGAGLDLQAQVAQQQARRAAQNANLGYYQLGGNLQSQLMGYQQAGFQNQMSGLGAMQGTALNQQGYDQAAADRQYQDWLRQQAYPMQQIQFGAGIASQFPAQGAQQSQQQGTQYQKTPSPSIWNTILGGATSLAGAYMGMAEGGVVDEPQPGFYAEGGLAAPEFDFAYSA
jgi:hypothetical protein